MLPELPKKISSVIMYGALWEIEIDLVSGIKLTVAGIARSRESILFGSRSCASTVDRSAVVRNFIQKVSYHISQENLTEMMFV